MSPAEPGRPEAAPGDGAGPVGAEAAAEPVAHVPPQPEQQEHYPPQDAAPIPQQAGSAAATAADGRGAAAPRRRRARWAVAGLAACAVSAGGIVTGLALTGGGHGAPALATGTASYHGIADGCGAVGAAELAAVGIPAHAAPSIHDAAPGDGLTTDDCTWSATDGTPTTLEVFVSMLRGPDATARARTIEATDVRAYGQERAYAQASTRQVPGLGDRAALLVDRDAGPPPSADGFLFIQSRNVVIQVLSQRQLPRGSAAGLPSTADLDAWNLRVGRQVLRAAAAG